MKETNTHSATHKETTEQNIPYPPELEKLRDEFLSLYGAEDEIALRLLNDYLESLGFSKKEINLITRVVVSVKGLCEFVARP